jgi:hypothetical protein
MLRLDPSTLPDPYKPQKWDAYGSAPGKHEFIVADVFVSNAALYQSIYVHSGETRTIPADDLALVLATLGLQPTGRMTDEPLPVGPRIEPGEDFHAYVEPGSFHDGVLVGRREALDPVDGGLMEPEHRLLARKFGPILRMAREKHRVKLGDLARALGCQTAALSAFELGERPGDKQPAGTSEMEASPRKRSRYDVTGEPLLQPSAQMTVMRLSGHETSWYTAHKTGYVDFNDADYIVEAGERYRIHEGRFEAEATKPAPVSPPADNVAIETGRDVLAAALAKAVWLVQDYRSEAAMLRSEEYATIHTAIHEALKEPEAREGLKLYADGLAPDEPAGHTVEIDITAQVQAGLVAEAVRLIELAEGVYESNWKDPQHAAEALQQALAILKPLAG